MRGGSVRRRSSTIGCGSSTSRASGPPQVVVQVGTSVQHRVEELGGDPDVARGRHPFVAGDERVGDGAGGERARSR